MDRAIYLFGFTGSVDSVSRISVITSPGLGVVKVGIPRLSHGMSRNPEHAETNDLYEIEALEG